jgi:hypothetical protein
LVVESNDCWVLRGLEKLYEGLGNLEPPMEYSDAMEGDRAMGAANGEQGECDLEKDELVESCFGGNES